MKLFLALSLGLVGLVLLMGVLFVPLASAHPTESTPTPAYTPTLAYSADNAPSYYDDVAPILAENCTICHVEGGIGGFDLTTYEGALDASPWIAEAVLNRQMPPWLPSVNTPPLEHDRRLSDEEIDTLVAWNMVGAPGGDPESASPLPTIETTSIRADMVLEVPTYTPDDSLSDDYRCFLIDPDLPEDRYITGYNIEPDQADIVHHVLLFQVNENLRELAMKKDAEDAAEGWQCFGGPNLVGVEGGALEGSVGAWAPGTPPTIYPEGTGRLLREDGLIVLQMHYYLEDAEAHPDRSKVIFQLSEPNADLTALEIMPLIAPVEIPCPEGVDSVLCDRQTAIDKLVAVEGERVAARATGILRLCGKNTDDYLSQAADFVVSECDHFVTTNGEIIGVFPHMHTHGSQIIIEKNSHRADEELLLEIPAWDFHWQGTYQYIEPIPVELGDKIRITCVWDNSEGDRYIIWGEGTQDEMCLAALVIRPS